MQQRQLRLGDILDDYCPRERRVTNHAVVAMVGDDVKQTRCTTCDADHEYKHAKVPRQRRKNETPAALYSQVLANGPKRVAHEGAPDGGDAAVPVAVPPPPDDQGEESRETPESAVEASAQNEPAPQGADASTDENADADSDRDDERDDEDGPIHRRLIRASLPRPEGQQPPARPIPEFTIRQPGGRQNRFRPRHQRGPGGGQPFGGGGNRGNGNMPGGPPRGGGGMRPGGGRPPQGAMPQRMSGRRHGPGGRKRSK